MIPYKFNTNIKSSRYKAAPNTTRNPLCQGRQACLCAVKRTSCLAEGAYLLKEEEKSTGCYTFREPLP